MKFKFFDKTTGETTQEYEFNPSQERFWRSEKKFVLFSGGFGCGKSLMLILKAIYLSEKYPGNYILMGRRTYREMEDSMIKDFFTICPPEYIQAYFKAEKRLVFYNRSEIVFRHLDTISETEIRSMNLGSVFIDQAEDISKEVFTGLRGRLRRKGIPERRIFLSCNPALTWLYETFKQAEDVNYEVVEASTMENKKNLPQEYVDDLLSYPEAYKRQYVYGIWDESLLSDRVVFDREYLERLLALQRDPIFEKDGLQFYREFIPGHSYQIGIDPAEGGGVTLEGGKVSEAGDFAAVTVVDLDEEEEVASWSGRVPPDVLAEKVIRWAQFFETKDKKPLLVPEMNAVGLALLHGLYKGDVRMYRREDFDKRTGKKIERDGWRTTRATKPLLVTRFAEMLRKRNPRVYSAATLAQFKTFVYSDESRMSGTGAQRGFNDDRIISLLLAFWQKKPIEEGSFTKQAKGRRIDSMIKIIRGRAVVAPKFDGERVGLPSMARKWITT